MPNVDHIYKISFDAYHGELFACTADNNCYLWDIINFKLKIKFTLQSPGISICWHRDETNKVNIIR